MSNEQKARKALCAAKAIVEHHRRECDEEYGEPIAELAESKRSALSGYDEALRLIDEALAEQPAKGEAVACVRGVQIDYLKDDNEFGAMPSRYAEPGDLLLYTAPPAPEVPRG